MSGRDENRQPYWSVTGEASRVYAMYYHEIGGGIVVVTVGRCAIHLRPADARRLAEQILAGLLRAEQHS